MSYDEDELEGFKIDSDFDPDSEDDPMVEPAGMPEIPDFEGDEDPEDRFH